MDQPITQLLPSVLSRVQRPGSFCASGARSAPTPRLVLEGVGVLSFPFQPFQATQLIGVAERAPYGRGGQTLVDTSVRRSWQIAPSALRFEDARWPETLREITAEMASGLGVDGEIEAQLYKLLVYEEGSFFVEHRDTEKAPGMFATLVVVLPSLFEGGELVVSHSGRQTTLSLSGDDPGEITYAAFYADCVHELRPVRAGYRLALVYNLVRPRGQRAPAPPDHRPEQREVVALLREWDARAGAPLKLVVPLEHHYTAAELGFSTVKGADAARADVLEAACEEAGCDLYLAMISIEESGSAIVTGYSGYERRWRGYDDDDDDDEDGVEWEPDEIFERTEALESWIGRDDAPAPFGRVRFSSIELAPPDVLSSEEPDEQHFLEATGNEGATFDRTYRRAAWVLWPRGRTLAVLVDGGRETAVRYLGALAERWRASEMRDVETWRVAHALAGRILDAWGEPLGHEDWREQDERSARLLAHMVALKDAPKVRRFLEEVLAKGGYRGTEDEAIEASLRLIGWNNGGAALRALALTSMYHRPAAVICLLRRLAGARWTGASAPGGLRALADAVISTLPGTPTPAELPRWHHVPAPDAILVVNLLTALGALSDSKLTERTMEHLAAHQALFPLDAVLKPALLSLNSSELSGSPPVQCLRGVVLEPLRRRVALPLEPPADLRREAKLACTCADCREVVRFLRDPQQATFTLWAAKERRVHVEGALKVGQNDVDCETLRKGSPHGLVMKKNQASYERRVAQRREDLEVLARVG